ncbi:MAG: VOC family protein [Thermoleophilia bacterium]|nr:VOC family protein [Thermoleophilia bacterium]
MIVGFHHVALTVSDIERSLPFYRDLFGLEVISDREVEGDYVERITGVPGAHVRLVHLSGHGALVELVSYLRPAGARRARALPDAGSAHLCFVSDDLEAETARLRERGVPLLSEGIVTTTSGPNLGGRGIYVSDPDGNAVEVVELARPRPAAEA